MKLKLVLDGVEKEFKTGERIPALLFKESLIISKELEKDFSIEKLDKAVEFVANRLFHKQFTPEQVWEGLDTHELFKVIPECLQHPMKMVNEKLLEAKN